MIRKLIPYFAILFLVIVFFWQFFIKGLLPIPSDTIIGLYHPYRDSYAREYPNGIPFKNFLITDPVRQQYPWKDLSIENLRKGELPMWNPYAFSGTPLLANFQSAVFYPLNIIFLALPLNYSWSIFIILQPFLAGIFIYLYLRNLKLDIYSSLLGSIIFSFSGFSTTWLEWGNVLHTALWLPLVLLSIDKIITEKKRNNLIAWSGILIFSSISSFFAGHLQTFFYLSLLSSVYLLIRIWQSDNKKKLSILFLITWLITLVITSVQLIPTLKYILLSSRSLDQILWQKEGWFLPWQNLVQLLVPDFFGNPTTLNYWGIWNYGELTAYAGVISITLTLFALIFRKDKKTYFFGGVFLISLVFALPNFISKLPFVLEIPFISSSQPTRLIFLVDFSLAILSALGLNYLINKEKIRQIIIPIGMTALVFGGIFTFVQMGNQFGLSQEKLMVSQRNLIFPVLIFVVSSVLIFSIVKVRKDLKKFALILLLLITIFDLFRFSWKFNTFSKSEYLFPQTKSLDFISKNIGNHRLATNDARILPPNFSSVYKIQTVEGYDPLYLNKYAEFISAINRNEPNIDPPYGFNRIVRIENFSKPLVDLLGVKYLLTLTEISEEGFVKVFEEGQTKVYENKNVLPRAFFVNNVIASKSKQETIDSMFDPNFDPSRTAIVEGEIDFGNVYASGEVEIIKYSDNEIILKTKIDSGDLGFLVLTDSYYPNWHAKIEGYDSEPKVFMTDYNFRGLTVPPGEQIVKIYYKYL